MEFSCLARSWSASCQVQPGSTPRLKSEECIEIKVKMKKNYRIWVWLGQGPLQDCAGSGMEAGWQHQGGGATNATKYKYRRKALKYKHTGSSRRRGHDTNPQSPICLSFEILGIQILCSTVEARLLWVFFGLFDKGRVDADGQVSGIGWSDLLCGGLFLGPNILWRKETTTMSRWKLRKMRFWNVAIDNIVITFYQMVWKFRRDWNKNGW